MKHTCSIGVYQCDSMKLEISWEEEKRREEKRREEKRREEKRREEKRREEKRREEKSSYGLSQLKQRQVWSLTCLAVKQNGKHHLDRVQDTDEEIKWPLGQGFSGWPGHTCWCRCSSKIQAVSKFNSRSIYWTSIYESKLRYGKAQDQDATSSWNENFKFRDWVWRIKFQIQSANCRWESSMDAFDFPLISDDGKVSMYRSYVGIAHTTRICQFKIGFKIQI